jgi:hypothetical protein
MFSKFKSNTSCAREFALRKHTLFVKTVNKGLWDLHIVLHIK